MNCFRLLRLAERQCFCVSKISSTSYATQHPFRFMETQDRWQEKDGVSKQWQLIYKAPMGTVINLTSTYLTVTTGIMGASAIYYAAFVYDVADINKPVIIGENVVIANSAIECLTYFGGFIALHVAVKMLLSQYVLRLYKDHDDYIAIYRGFWYNSIIKHKFHLNDCIKLNPITIIPWSTSRYSLGNKKGILLENHFKTPEHLNYLITKRKMNIDEEEE